MLIAESSYEKGSQTVREGSRRVKVVLFAIKRPTLKMMDVVVQDFFKPPNLTVCTFAVL